MNDHLLFGGDYNPEQWPRPIWDEDIALMTHARVNTATVGVFSWARLEPRPGEYDFEWLDDVLDRLHTAGIGVILATATASPPAWLATQHPESLPVSIDGTRLAFGSRQQYSPSSTAYAHHAARLVERLAERYAGHPSLIAWHIGNEYGGHAPRSYDPESAAAFRTWLTARYNTIEHLNHAWGTAFWSQRYDDFTQIDVPAAAPGIRNPTQVLDFDRFSSDAMLQLYRMERSIIERFSTGIPITTNFMGIFKDADYWQWAAEVDIVSDDLYPDPADPRSHLQAAATRDLMRSLGGGKPWLLMEQATSAVNWRDRNAPKAPGLYRLQSLQALMRGADGILHFQWRQSIAGAEKFHSAMLPHAGPDSRIHREVTALGKELSTLNAVLAQPVAAEVAIVFDWDSWRALEQDAVPASRDYVTTILAWYEGFYRRGVTVDFVAKESDTSGYRIVLAPLLHVLTDTATTRLAGVAERGDTLIVGYQSGVLDENLHIHAGGYLGGAAGPLQRALGVRVEEFAPLPAADDTTALNGLFTGEAREWQESILVDTAEVLARFGDGFATGQPAITRNRTVHGPAWYLGTEPGTELRDRLVECWLTDAGIRAPFERPEAQAETVTRAGLRLVGNYRDQDRVIVVDGQRVQLPAYSAVLLDTENPQ